MNNCVAVHLFSCVRKLKVLTGRIWVCSLLYWICTLGQSSREDVREGRRHVREGGGARSREDVREGRGNVREGRRNVREGGGARSRGTTERSRGARGRSRGTTERSRGTRGCSRERDLQGHRKSITLNSLDLYLPFNTLFCLYVDNHWFIKALSIIENLSCIISFTSSGVVQRKYNTRTSVNLTVPQLQSIASPIVEETQVVPPLSVAHM